MSTYRQSDFEYWDSHIGKPIEKEFLLYMSKRGKPVEYYNQIDKRVDFRSIKSPNIYYEPKGVGKFPPDWLISHLGMHFPIVLDAGKVHHYQDFIREDPKRKLFIVIKLHYPESQYVHVYNGWYYIDAKDLSELYDRTPFRKYERKLRDDEKKTGKKNVIKWHIEFDELKEINNFQ